MFFSFLFSLLLEDLPFFLKEPYRAPAMLGRKLAIAVTKGGSPCSDSVLLELANYKKEQDAKGRTFFYDMPQEYEVDGDCVFVYLIG